MLSVENCGGSREFEENLRFKSEDVFNPIEVRHGIVSLRRADVLTIRTPRKPMDLAVGGIGVAESSECR
jgi:hypothetical protein